ncbi:MAG: glycosyltransferase family 39 protein [Candidatus Sungiibacteriota bacterium]|uniref:Glycosyltransferase family 39 protein n=1 Tax=Candidatus Sungiibacteriota bacterium TaxID=2750080 RepID=A0A7T5RJ79_9BACT|nr:MAG: glycosyltransferase family 39 protein [Candidatus Sungbacteria bacterium]
MKKVNIGAATILLVMLFLMLDSIRNDSAIMDELAHIPAGFGYVTQLDYRLNPEHPPLLKALAALSGQIFTKPHFPTDTPYWQDDINGQWAQGTKFLYNSGNNADKIIFWSRFPLILLAILFGWLFFDWTKKRFGNTVALLALTFFAFSPTFLTHSRYVTTDLGAAFGFFIGIITFLKFLEAPTWKNLLVSALAFGVAQLIKFSLILLIPLYGLLWIFWVFSQPNLHFHERVRVGLRYLWKIAMVGVLGMLLVWLVYVPFTWNYPQARQLRDTEFLLSSYGFRPPVDFDIALVKNKITRPLGQYLLGVLMVNQRALGGNTQFFLGEVSNTGSRSYFPLLYLLKEPLALHVLTLVAVWFSIKKSNFLRKFDFGGGRGWIENHFIEFSALVFIAFYWLISIKSPLNIGVRHVLPTFPFIYLLVAKQITEWLRFHKISTPQNWIEWLKIIYQIFVKSVPKYIFVALMILWLTLGTVSAYPHFMTYYNEFAGGSRSGWKIAVDSNYDWGQDLKRLAQYVEKNKIEKIAVDYFGGGDPKYYLDDKFEGWWSGRGPAHDWFAISATFRQSAFGTPAPGFIRKPEDSYEWLKPYPPVAQIGSIFIYKLP